ncbi:hypothetical protein [Streptomyces goshikiensis]|uniref:hypothetical protein n=1 Tax=Streptomyces goshikiensis TaxID=1942 RepID=UPI002E13C702|nr:hypothetical protein OG224_06925 [Streptomyces goshikiensis]
MSAPTEPRPEDVLQQALAAEDQWYRDLFGPQNTWSETVVVQYLIDCHLARQRATNWGEAA